MIVANASRQTVIAANASEARSFAQKLFGLMGKRALSADAALIIYHTNWIHTFWMRFALDLIYLDRERKVVGLEAGLGPNRIGKPFWKAETVIELCAGAISASRTEIGDQLRIGDGASH